MPDQEVEIRVARFGHQEGARHLPVIHCRERRGTHAQRGSKIREQSEELLSLQLMLSLVKLSPLPRKVT
jgi:hypothetical protein